MSKKGGILKTLLGCGCLLVVLTVVLTLALSWFVYDRLSAVDWDKTLDPETYTQKIDTDMFADYGVRLDEVGDALTRPMEEADADRFLTAHDWFHEQPEAANVGVSLDDVRNDFSLDKALGLLERQNAVLGLMVRFDEHIAENGGYIKQTDSAVRSIGTAAAVEAVAQATGTEPESDAVAKQVSALSSEAHTKVKDADPKAIAKFLAEQEVAGVKLDSVPSDKLKTGVVALSRLPSASFDNWTKLSKDKRKRLIDAYQKQRKFVIMTHLNPVLNTAQMITTIQGLQ